MDAQQIYYLSKLMLAVSIGVSSGIMGVVYVLILTQPGQVLSWWSKLIHNTYDKIFVRDSDRWFKYDWILKPILTCELCVSGQIALWSFIFFALFPLHVFNIFGLIFCICLSILTAWAIARKMNQ